MYGVIVSRVVVDWARVLRSGEEGAVMVETDVALVSSFDRAVDSVWVLDVQLGAGSEILDCTLSCLCIQGLAIRVVSVWVVVMTEGLGGGLSSFAFSLESVPRCLGAEKQRKRRNERSMVGFIVFV